MCLSNSPITAEVTPSNSLLLLNRAEFLLMQIKEVRRHLRGRWRCREGQGLGSRLSSRWQRLQAAKGDLN